MKKLGFAAALLCTASIGFAGTIDFSGSGSSGTVDPGLGWTTTISGNDLIWGIPGFDDGGAAWTGTDGMTALSFTLTGSNFLNTGIDDGAYMADANTEAPWTTEVSNGGDTITFTAPEGDVVTPGELFFVDIPIGIQNTTDYTPVRLDTINFTGTWTTVPAGVPEPGSFLLLGGGLAGLGWIARKRSKA